VNSPRMAGEPASFERSATGPALRVRPSSESAPLQRDLMCSSASNVADSLALPRDRPMAQSALQRGIKRFVHV
jgi:hypothetical protein